MFKMLHYTLTCKLVHAYLNPDSVG